jgi:SAM-dependent methyltransferase
MKLDLGAKSKADTRVGYEGVDFVEGDGLNHVFDITKPWPIAPNSVEAVSSAHFFEHITDQDAQSVLDESFRALQEGGEIQIDVPDLPEVCKLFYDGDAVYRWTGLGLMTLFGDRNRPGQYHINGYDADKLTFLLENAGFKDVTCEKIWSHGTACLLAKGYKRGSDSPKTDG